MDIREQLAGCAIDFKVWVLWAVQMSLNFGVSSMRKTETVILKWHFKAIHVNFKGKTTE